MSRSRSITRGVSGALLVAGIGLALAAPAQASDSNVISTAQDAIASATPTAQPAATTAPGPLYKTPFSDALFAVSGGQLDTITYAQWRDTYNFEAPTKTSEAYDTYSWSPTIYSVSSFPGTELTFVVALDYAQWQSVGSPTPAVQPLISGSALIKWGTSAELFIATPSAEFHKLSRSEWDATGDAQYQDLAPAGFLKLSWNDKLGFVKDTANPGVAEILTPADWAQASYPTPVQAQRLPGDAFTQRCGSSAITYAGPTLFKQLTLAEWQAAGSPSPTVTCG